MRRIILHRASLAIGFRKRFLLGHQAGDMISVLKKNSSAQKAVAKFRCFLIVVLNEEHWELSGINAYSLDLGPSLPHLCDTACYFCSCINSRFRLMIKCLISPQGNPQHTSGCSPYVSCPWMCHTPNLKCCVGGPF